MKNITILFLLILMPVYCFASDPACGFWISVDDKSGKVMAGWEIFENDGKLGGKIIALSNFPQDQKAAPCKESYEGFPASGKVNEMTVIGTQWIWGLSKDGEGQWSGGSIVDPKSGNLYKCRITFHAADGKKYKTDTLELRGEIGMGIGRSQFWKKSSAQEISEMQ
jgi:uncharacterized protein (DUF2147 family)